MPHISTPWAGLVALIAMFVLPYLPSWLFDGPRTVRHRPLRHICADCGARWMDGHQCATESPPARRVLRGELRRISTSTDLVVPAEQSSEPDY